MKFNLKKPDLSSLSLKNLQKKFIIFICAMMALWGFLFWFIPVTEVVTINNTETKIVDVIQVQQVVDGKMVTVPQNVDAYFVYTDKRTFQIRQSLFFLQINVADPFGRLKADKTYKITHYWFRSAIFDQYENIISFEEIDPVSGEVISNEE